MSHAALLRMILMIALAQFLSQGGITHPDCIGQMHGPSGYSNKAYSAICSQISPCVTVR